MMNCNSCGKEIADNSKFCRFCSAPQIAKPSVPSCKKCGSALLPNAKFCKGCGEKITQLDAEKNINEPAEQQPVKLAATPPASIQSAASQPQVQSPSYAKPTPSKNNKSFIYIIIGLVAISLLGFAGYKVWEYKKKTEEQAIIAKQQADAAAQLKAEEEAKIKADIEAKKLLGVDIKTAILQILPDESASFTAPDPLTVRKAFEPCKFSGEGGEISSKCQIQSNGEILVSENVENDRKVDLKTSGARSMVNQIAMSAKFPNDIQSALNGFNDWNIKEVNCGQDTSIDNLTIYTAKPTGKREFVFETSYDGGSGGNWGRLNIHLAPIANNNPCALMNPQSTTSNEAGNEAVMNLANDNSIQSELNIMPLTEMNWYEVIERIPKECHPSKNGPSWFIDWLKSKKISYETADWEKVGDTVTIVGIGTEELGNFTYLRGKDRCEDYIKK